MLKKRNLSLLLLLAAPLLTIGCNGGTTNNYYNNTVVDCQLPTFNESIGNYMLQKWGSSAIEYGTNNYPDQYTGAAYFTMNNYTPDAVLLPTVSDIQKVGTQRIYNYFTKFLQLNPVMSLPNPESNVFSAFGCGYGGANGYYNFIINPNTPQESSVQARFTFIYKYESQPFSESVVVSGGPQVGTIITQINPPGWYIWTQNSSALPQAN